VVSAAVTAIVVSSKRVHVPLVLWGAAALCDGTLPEIIEFVVDAEAFVNYTHFDLFVVC
jgi:hypothetical protein